MDHVEKWRDFLASLPGQQPAFTVCLLNMTAMIDDFSLLTRAIWVKPANQYEITGRSTIVLPNHPILPDDFTAPLRCL